VTERSGGTERTKPAGRRAGGCMGQRRAGDRCGQRDVSVRRVRAAFDWDFSNREQTSEYCLNGTNTVSSAPEGH